MSWRIVLCSAGAPKVSIGHLLLAIARVVTRIPATGYNLTMRVVSLLPAATEIVGALGPMDQLVGVSHECDFPPEANAKPRVTHCEIHEAGLPSAEVDRWVGEALASRGTLYTMDEPLLRRLQPDVI